MTPLGWRDSTPGRGFTDADVKPAVEGLMQVPRGTTVGYPKGAGGKKKDKS